jgi:Domain of unknown function (DUF4296)
MRLRIGVLLLLFFIIGCKNTSVPDGIIEQKKMQAILQDLTRAEEFVNTYVLKDTTKKHKDECMQWYHKVFSIYHTDSKLFLKSLDYYLSTPKVARDMFDSISTQSRRIQANVRPT